MIEDDAREFLRELAVVAETFDRTLSDPVLMIYFDALKDQPLDACLRALRTAIKTKTFMPKPAELRGLIESPGGDPELADEMAWLQYKELARRHGQYASVENVEGALAATILAVFGSWPEACGLELSSEMWASKRKEFGRVYRTMRANGVAAPQRLVGFCEQENTRRGLGPAYEPTGILRQGTSTEQLVKSDAVAALRARAFERDLERAPRPTPRSAPVIIDEDNPETIRKRAEARTALEAEAARRGVTVDALRAELFGAE